MQRISGIFGLENFSSAEAIEIVSKMLSQGREISLNLEVWSDERNLVLGAAGQSVVDTNSGDTIILSGEIENTLELIDHLKSEGVQVENTVLLTALKAWGLEATLKKLKGKFSFAWWCASSEKLVIARDRFGIKPIYWCAENEKGAIIFASEIKTLLASGLISRKVNKEALIDYLRYSTVHGPLTIVEGIQLLEPGCAIEIYEETVNVLRWWETSKDALIKDSQSIKDTLLKAVNSKLAGDSPAIYLSGGLNSITLTAAMFQLSSQPINTFSVAFEGSETSTENEAHKISNNFATNHTEVSVSNLSIYKKLHNAIDQMDHPSSNGLRNYFIATSAKEAGYSTIISDLGCNEIFGENPSFNTSVQLMKHRWLTSWPRGLRVFVGSLLKTLSPGQTSNKKAEILASNYFDLEHTYPLARQRILDNQIKKLTPSIKLTRNRVFYFVADILRVGKAAFSLPFLSKVSVLEIQTYLTNTLLRDAHTFNSENDIDYKTPFLDHNLVTKVLSFNDSVKPTLKDIKEDIDPKRYQNNSPSSYRFPWELTIEGIYLDFHAEGIAALSDLEFFNKEAVHEFDSNSLTSTQQRLSLSTLGHYFKQNKLS
ncbi:MAG: hypothetical protein HOM41_05560 [Flavobacteriales bacterium]|nr:hypothetical protein [Flavobacteriales bacterium]